MTLTKKIRGNTNHNKLIVVSPLFTFHSLSYIEKEYIPDKIKALLASYKILGSLLVCNYMKNKYG